jgi:hypothetical protein
MTTTTTDTTAGSATGEPIVACAGTYYRVTRYIFSAVMLAMGAWFAYDGYVTYPRHNEQHRLHVLDPQQNPKDAPTHSEADIRLQKILGVALPAVGVGLLAWTLYNSRGEYRLAGDVLGVPGHPEVPLDYVTQIDKSKWDRKGIAYLDYALPTGRKGRLKLDDFVYDRPPTDRILETIEARLGVASDGGIAAEPNAPDDSSNASS